MVVAWQAWPCQFLVNQDVGRKEDGRGVPLIEHPDQVCHSCLAAKQTQKSFPQCAKWRADGPLELIHVDLCGPITPEIVGGNK